MRWIAIGLLIGNVILFGWQFNQHRNEQTAAVAGLPPLPRGTTEPKACLGAVRATAIKGLR